MEEFERPQKISATMTKLMKKYNCKTAEEYRAIRKERIKAEKAASKTKVKAKAPAPAPTPQKKKK
jgi:hypothetical protein